MRSSASSLVMGFAAGLGPESFDPFFRSLRATGFQGQTALVTLGYERHDIETFRRLADHVIDVPAPSDSLAASVRILRLLRGTRGLRRLYPLAFRTRCGLTPERRSYATWAALELQLEGLQSLRYGHYHDFLATRPPGIREILISDVRDVIFQSDPFGEPLEQLEFFLEDASHRLATDPFNGRWIRELEGPAFAREFAQRVPSCSGTVAGPAEDMLLYLGAMRTEISWRRIPMGSHDQGVHNVLIMKNRFPRAKIVPNGEGRVLTMGGMQQPRFEADGSVYGADGSRPAVIHQYDRFPSHAATVIAKYSAG